MQKRNYLGNVFSTKPLPKKHVSTAGALAFKSSQPPQPGSGHGETYSFRRSQDSHTSPLNSRNPELPTYSVQPELPRKLGSRRSPWNILAAQQRGGKIVPDPELASVNIVFVQTLCSCRCSIQSGWVAGLSLRRPTNCHAYVYSPVLAFWILTAHGSEPRPPQAANIASAFQTTLVLSWVSDSVMCLTFCTNSVRSPEWQESFITHFFLYSPFQIKKKKNSNNE